MNFYDVLAAEKWGGGIPTMNFFDLLFAQFIGGEQWETYEGTLPATFNANGDDMRQYRVWGNVGGVGDRTVQLFDKNATDTTNGYVNNAYLNTSGQVVNFGVYPVSHWQISEYISVEPNESYYQKSADAHQSPCLCEYDSSFGFLRATSFGGNDYIKIITTAQTRFVRLSAWDNNTNNFVMFTKGTTPHETYVPFGYEVDISTSDTTSNTVTPIYIGDEPLEKDEYVDYTEQKVYRRTVNYFDISAQTLIDVTGTGTMRTGVYLGFLAVGQYTLTFDAPHNYSLFITRKNGNKYTFQDINKSQLPFTFLVNSDDEIIVRLSNTQTFEQQQFTNICVTSGDTPPETYIPYFQPTDPPVTLPALPTAEGTTIIDYVGQSVAPEKVYFEYKGGKQP